MHCINWRLYENNSLNNSVKIEKKNEDIIVATDKSDKSEEKEKL